MKAVLFLIIKKGLPQTQNLRHPFVFIKKLLTVICKLKLEFCLKAKLTFTASEAR